MSDASSILAEAARLVDGKRDETHGPQRTNFACTAGVWNWYLMHRKPGPLTGADVAEMMSLSKLARRMKGAPDPDHWIDGCGYTAIAAELSAHHAAMAADLSE